MQNVWKAALYAGMVCLITSFAACKVPQKGSNRSPSPSGSQPDPFVAPAPAPTVDNSTTQTALDPNSQFANPCQYQVPTQIPSQFPVQPQYVGKEGCQPCGGKTGGCIPPQYVDPCTGKIGCNPGQYPVQSPIQNCTGKNCNYTQQPQYIYQQPPVYYPYNGTYVGGTYDSWRTGSQYDYCGQDNYLAFSTGNTQFSIGNGARDCRYPPRYY